MRPCGATRAGTQAPPLPISVIHPRTILQNDINHPNETRKQSTHNTSGAEMHRALPPPFFEIKKCVYSYDFGATVDDVIYFKTNYSFGVTVASPCPLPPGLSLPSPGFSLPSPPSPGFLPSGFFPPSPGLSPSDGFLSPFFFFGSTSCL